MNVSLIRLKHQPCLGALAKISIRNLHIQVDSYLQLLNRLLKAKGLRPDSISINDILSVASSTDARPFWSQSADLKICLARLSKKKQNWFLDELPKTPGGQTLYVPILAQLLFERFTSITTRLTCVESPQGELQLAVAVKLVDQREVIFFAMQNDVLSPICVEGYRLCSDDFQITCLEPLPKANAAVTGFRLATHHGLELHFDISGRTPSDRRFEQEEVLIHQARPKDLVPIEIYYHPYYRAFGHTTLRIGRTMYELSMKGWRSHGPPGNSARAFIFNNPFFRSQYEKFRETGMAPFSTGKTIYIEKEKVLQIQNTVRKLALLEGWSKPRFNLLINNCNQGLVRVLNKAGLPLFPTSGYTAFSSVLSFRKLLFDQSLASGGLRIYPLPNSGFDPASARSDFPKHLYYENSVALEMARALPVYTVDMATLPLIWLKKQKAKLVLGRQKISSQLPLPTSNTTEVMQ